DGHAHARSHFCADAHCVAIERGRDGAPPAWASTHISAIAPASANVSAARVHPRCTPARPLEVEREVEAWSPPASQAPPGLEPRYEGAGSARSLDHRVDVGTVADKRRESGLDRDGELGGGPGAPHRAEARRGVDDVPEGAELDDQDPPRHRPEERL